MVIKIKEISYNLINNYKFLDIKKIYFYFLICNILIF